jgi:drug/metabolite transporter (DMT)-like permease
LNGLLANKKKIIFMKTKLWAIGLVILTTILISIAQVLFKIGAEKLPVILTNWYIAGGIFIYAFSTVLLVYAFKGGDVSILYPLIATGYVWVSLFSVFIFSETISIVQWGGISTIIIGIILVSRKGGIV